MKRAAIYARMSTDKQNQQSPADQVRECRRFAERQGYDVVADLVFEEAGISGASRHNRPLLLELIARIDEWDVLLAFDFSRLARNQEDQGWILNQLRSRRKQAFEASTGLDLENVGAGVMGVLNAEHLKKIAASTHTGLRAKFDRKLATGGCPFGYRTVPIVTGTDSHGQPINAGFRMEVEPERAAVVCRIFSASAAGEGAKQIAKLLNAEGAPTPVPRGSRLSRGRPSWSPTSIHAMLSNPIYRGERIWNRSTWVKDHETGRRRRLERDPAEWLRDHDEALRIVDDELWHAANDARRRRGGRSTLR